MMTDLSNTPHTAFDNDDESHRRSLIAALQQYGFSAYEYHSGGGCMHVVVDLFNDGPGMTNDILQIATGSIESLCDVGLMGWRNGANAQGSDWKKAATLDEARMAFQHYWQGREQWIQRFLNNEFDC